MILATVQKPRGCLLFSKCQEYNLQNILCTETEVLVLFFRKVHGSKWHQLETRILLFKKMSHSANGTVHTIDIDSAYQQLSFTASANCVPCTGPASGSARLLFPGWGTLSPLPVARGFCAQIVHSSAAGRVRPVVLPLCSPVSGFLGGKSLPAWPQGFTFTTPCGILWVSELEPWARVSFLSHNSCPVSDLSLITPSACALGNFRVLCVLESLALGVVKSSPLRWVPLTLWPLPLSTLGRLWWLGC